MRTTIEIDDDLLLALKELARVQGLTLGQVISDLTRRFLPANTASKTRNGVRVFAPKDANVKSDIHVVNALRD